METGAEHISVNTVRNIFLLHKVIVLHTQCQKQQFRVFSYTAVLFIFGNTGGNFIFNWILTVKTSVLCLLIQLSN